MNAVWLPLLIVGIFITVLILLAHKGSSEHSSRSKAAYNVKGLLLCCRAYAADHGGSYPPSLGDLYPDYTDMEEIFFAADKDGRRLPIRIRYYSGHTNTSDANTILLEYPVVFKGYRIVGYVGGHVMEVPVN